MEPFPSTENWPLRAEWSQIAYVKQADIFFEHLTVRDQVMYTALLQMESSKSTAEKSAEVDKELQQLP
jgi:ABC-type multidrug transport system ATPase subunit